MIFQPRRCRAPILTAFTTWERTAVLSMWGPTMIPPLLRWPPFEDGGGAKELDCIVGPSSCCSPLLGSAATATFCAFGDGDCSVFSSRPAFQLWLSSFLRVSDSGLCWINC